MSKRSEEYMEMLRGLDKPIEQVINELPVKTLLRIGKRVCSTDFAVRFYRNKRHPSFHLNKEALRHAIRRAWAQGAFNHREQILDILDDEGYVKRAVDKFEQFEPETITPAVCEYCGKVMLECDGCIPSVFVDRNNNEVPAYKYGEEPNYGDVTTPCGDCRCEKGGYHHPECDMELCPICGQQALFRTCGHIRKFESGKKTWR